MLTAKYFDNPVPFLFTSSINEFFCETFKLIDFEILVDLKGLDAERDVLRESQRLASERDRELETLRQQVRFLLTTIAMWRLGA